jgi:hypothetical protein
MKIQNRNERKGCAKDARDLANLFVFPCVLCDFFFANFAVKCI